MEMKKFNIMLEIDILRNSSRKVLGGLRGAFKGFGCPKRHPDALPARVMVCGNSLRSKSIIGKILRRKVLTSGHCRSTSHVTDLHIQVIHPCRLGS